MTASPVPVRIPSHSLSSRLSFRPIVAELPLRSDGQRAHANSPSTDQQKAIMTPNVLFIDNDVTLLTSIRLSMRQESFQVRCAESTDDARLVMASELIDLVVCDEPMPGTSGSEFLAELRQSYPRTVRIMLSGQSSVGAVVQAINAGEVFRFLLKPCGHGEPAGDHPHRIGPQGVPRPLPGVPTSVPPPE